MPETVRVMFQAQEWIGENPTHAERTPNKEIYTVPYEDALTEDGELVSDDSYESDTLATHPNAPDWVTEWAEESKGPYYIQTEIVN